MMFLETLTGTAEEITNILYKIKRIFTGLLNIQEITKLAPDIQELMETSSLPNFTQKFLKNPSNYPNVLDHVNHRQRPKKSKNRKMI